MSEVFWVAIIGVIGTISGSIIGFLCNQWLEGRRAKNDTRQYVSRAHFDLQIEIYKQLSKAFFKVLVILNTVENEIKTGENDKRYIFNTCKRLTEATCDAQNILFENAPFIPDSIYTKYDKLNDVINNQFWDYYDSVVKTNNETKEIRLSDVTTVINLVEYKIREINTDIRMLITNTSILSDQ